MGKIDEQKRKDFYEEVLMLANQYRLTKEDILDIFGAMALRENEHFE